MRAVLIVDDEVLFRAPIAAFLRQHGYSVSVAQDGAQGLAALKSQDIGLVITDLHMPVLNGAAMITAMRKDPVTAMTPVVLYTAETTRADLLRVARLGIQGCIIKTKMTLPEIARRVLEIVDRAGLRPPLPDQSDAEISASPHWRPGPAAVPIAALPDADGPPSRAPTIHAATGKPRIATPAHAKTSPLDLRPLLPRQDIVARVNRATQDCTLAGTVAEVIAMAGSVRSDVSDLVDVVSRDAVIASRVLHVANSAAFGTNKIRISTLDEAVRNVGMRTVREIALSVSIFEAFPPSSGDGFNSLLCWRHCLAVSRIMDNLVVDPPEDAAAAQLAGLCHDLGDLILRSALPDEYATIGRLCAEQRMPVEIAEQHLLGFTHAELVDLALKSFSLPPTLADPIRAFHAGDFTSGPVVRALRVADLYANGLLLAATPHAPLMPLRRQDVQRVTGGREPDLGRHELCSEIMTTAFTTARLDGPDAQRLLKPTLPKLGASVIMVRHPGFAEPCPIAACLDGLTQVATVRQDLPAVPRDVARCDAVVVVVPRLESSGYTIFEAQQALRSCGKPELPLLYLVTGDLPDLDPPAGVGAVKLPIGLTDLRDMLAQLVEKPTARPYLVASGQQ